MRLHWPISDGQTEYKSKHEIAYIFSSFFSQCPLGAHPSVVLLSHCRIFFLVIVPTFFTATAAAFIALLLTLPMWLMFCKSSNASTANGRLLRVISSSCWSIPNCSVYFRLKVFLKPFLEYWKKCLPNTFVAAFKFILSTATTCCATRFAMTTIYHQISQAEDQLPGTQCCFIEFEFGRQKLLLSFPCIPLDICVAMVR